MTKFFTNLLVVFLIMLGIIYLFSTVDKINVTKQSVSLNELIGKIQENKIKKIIVKPDTITGILDDENQLVAKKENTISVFETLKYYDVSSTTVQNLDISFAQDVDWGTILTLGSMVILPLGIIIFIFMFLGKGNKQGGPGQIFNFSQANLKQFLPNKDSIKFKDVAGLKEAKEELYEIVEFLKTPKKFTDLGAKIPRGVLLMGPPGCGKTMLARSVAGESGVPFFYISGSEFVEMFVGVGANRVRSAFQITKKSAPSILFIDEIDAIGRERGSGIGGGQDEREQTLNQILVEMDGFDKDTNVIVMAASVTGETPVLIRKNNQYLLRPISEIIDQYYERNEEGVEKEIHNDFQVLGFRSKENRSHCFDSALFQSARSVFRHKVKEIYEIEYLGGKLRTTGNHSVFIRNRTGVRAKFVFELKPGDFLVDLPYKVNRNNKNREEIRSCNFDQEFELELSVWQPLFEKCGFIDAAYQYALANVGVISQTQIGKQLGISQCTIGQWQRNICCPRQLSHNYYQHKDILPETVKVTPELMKLFGYYTAEGYSRSEVAFCFNSKEIDKIKEVESLMKDIFKVDYHIEKHTDHNATNIVYQSKPLADFFAKWCGRGAHNKYVPNFLFGAPKKYFIEFLRGYFAGDGHEDKRGRLEMTSMSKQLILELNWLSRMHGYKSFVHFFKTKEGRIINGGKPLSSSVAWRLGFGKTQNPLKKVEGKDSIKRPVVINVKKIPYNDYVYDFCGCENEAFFGGESPILLHNTNRPDVLDSALLRPGRFDRRIFLDLPDKEERRQILKIHLDTRKFDASIDLDKIAKRTPGFSGADLGNLINEGTILAARKNKKKVEELDILESVEKVMMGPERKSHVVNKNEKEITAYHEAGHALLAAILPHANPVHKISILPRGVAGGYTLQLPEEDKSLKTKSEFLDELIVFLGGYATEEKQFGEVSTGSSNDLKVASNSARAYVTKYGMSKLGPISFIGDESVFLGREMATRKICSEDMAARIDEEVNRLILDALKKAEALIAKNFDKIEKVAKVLLEKEVLEKDEFYALIKY